MSACHCLGRESIEDIEEFAPPAPKSTPSDDEVEMAVVYYDRNGVKRVKGGRHLKASQSYPLGWLVRKRSSITEEGPCLIIEPLIPPPNADGAQVWEGLSTASHERLSVGGKGCSRDCLENPEDLLQGEEELACRFEVDSRCELEPCHAVLVLGAPLIERRALDFQCWLASQKRGTNSPMGG